MIMTGKDRVKAALTHTGPDRAPRDLWALPYMSLFRSEELEEVQRAFPSDIGRPELSPGAGDEDLQKLSKPGTYTDEWGSVWQIGEPGIVGEVKKPVLADWAALDSFQPPWGSIRNLDLGHVNRACEKGDQFMLSSAGVRPFERMQFLRGTENVFMDLAYDTKEIRKLIEIIHEFFLAEVAIWATSDVDGIFFMDDWGTQQALLINPELWRDVFKPLYRDYCDAIHAAGKFVFFHSDGNIESIFGDLIEIGVDAVNSQLFCMDIEGLAAQYKGKITFWGEIDRQHVLPFGSQADVFAAVRRVRDALDDGSGGVIAQCEWGKDNSKDNIVAVFKAWLD
jgi:uroporphyrinogen decarboxylase